MLDELELGPLIILNPEKFGLLKSFAFEFTVNFTKICSPTITGFLSTLAVIV